jgi:ABC-type transport system substrate-binding protein
VGTGPYRLREWKRGSRIVLEANPGYRGARFPDSGNPAQAPLVRSMQGKILPQIGVIEIAVIDEDLPRLLAFEQGGLDLIVLRGEVANRLLVDGKIKPEYAARGITRLAYPEPFLFSIYFNVADPVIGGMGNEKIALRRAIALALDVETLLNVVYAGQAMPANQMTPPGVGGHDPSLPASRHYDPAAAAALLDRFGYRRDADGYRRSPDGKPLTLTFSQRTGVVSREVGTLWKRNMDAVGLRMEFRVAPFQEMIKALEKGQFQMYYGGFGGSPSGYNVHAQLHSRQPQRVNAVQFRSAEYDMAADLFLRSESDAGQIAAARRMGDVARTYMPLLPVAFRLESVVVQPWVQGFAPMTFSTYWKFLDIDLDRRRAATGK